MSAPNAEPTSNVLAGGDSVVLEEEIDPNYVPSANEVTEYAKWLGMDLEKDADLVWIAREGLMAPLPKEWKPCKTKDTEDVYYFNFSSGESTWDHPCDDYYKRLYEEEKKKKEMNLKASNDQKRVKAKQDVEQLLGKTDKKKKKPSELGSLRATGSTGGGVSSRSQSPLVGRGGGTSSRSSGAAEMPSLRKSPLPDIATAPSNQDPDERVLQIRSSSPDPDPRPRRSEVELSTSQRMGKPASAASSRLNSRLMEATTMSRPEATEDVVQEFKYEPESEDESKAPGGRRGNKNRRATPELKELELDSAPYRAPFETRVDAVESKPERNFLDSRSSFAADVKEIGGAATNRSSARSGSFLVETAAGSSLGPSNSESIQALKGAHERLEEYASEIKSLRVKSEDLSEQVQVLTAQLNSAKEKRKAVEAQNEEDIRDLERKYREARLRVGTLENEKDALEAIVSSEKNKATAFSDLSTKVQNQEKAFEALVEEKKKLLVSNLELETQVESLQKTVKRAQSIEDSLRKEVEYHALQYNDKAARLEGFLRDSRSEVEASRSEVEALKRERDGLRVAIQEKATESEKQVMDKTFAINNLQAELLSSQAEVVSLKDHFAQLLQQRGGDSAALELELQSVRGKLTEASKQLAQKEVELDHKSNLLAASERKLASDRAKGIADLAEAEDRLKKASHQHQESMQALRSLLSSKDAELDALRLSVSSGAVDGAGELAKMSETVTQRDKVIRGYQEELMVMQKRHTEIEESLGNKELEVIAREQEIERLKEEVATVLAVLEEERRDAAQSRPAVTGSQVTKVAPQPQVVDTSKIEELAGRLRESDAITLSLRVDQDRLETENASLKARASSLFDELQSARAAVDVFDSQKSTIAEQAGRIQEFDAEYASFKSSLSKLEMDKAALTSQVSALTQELQIARTDEARLKAKLSAEKLEREAMEASLRKALEDRGSMDSYTQNHLTQELQVVRTDEARLKAKLSAEKLEREAMEASLRKALEGALSNSNAVSSRLLEAEQDNARLNERVTALTLENQRHHHTDSAPQPSAVASAGPQLPVSSSSEFAQLSCLVDEQQSSMRRLEQKLLATESALASLQNPKPNVASNSRATITAASENSSFLPKATPQAASKVIGGSSSNSISPFLRDILNEFIKYSESQVGVVISDKENEHKRSMPPPPPSSYVNSQQADVASDSHLHHWIEKLAKEKKTVDNAKHMLREEKNSLRKQQESMAKKRDAWRISVQQLRTGDWQGRQRLQERCAKLNARTQRLNASVRQTHTMQTWLAERTRKLEKLSRHIAAALDNRKLREKHQGHYDNLGPIDDNLALVDNLGVELDADLTLLGETLTFNNTESEDFEEAGGRYMRSVDQDEFFDLISNDSESEDIAKFTPLSPGVEMRLGSGLIPQSRLESVLPGGRKMASPGSKSRRNARFGSTHSNEAAGPFISAHYELLRDRGGGSGGGRSSSQPNELRHEGWRGPPLTSSPAVAGDDVDRWIKAVNSTVTASELSTLVAAQARQRHIVGSLNKYSDAASESKNACEKHASWLDDLNSTLNKFAHGTTSHP